MISNVAANTPESAEQVRIRRVLIFFCKLHWNVTRLRWMLASPKDTSTSNPWCIYISGEVSTLDVQYGVRWYEELPILTTLLQRNVNDRRLYLPIVIGFHCVRCGFYVNITWCHVGVRIGDGRGEHQNLGGRALHRRDKWMTWRRTAWHLRYQYKRGTKSKSKTKK